ncbi:MAG: hypothetical protein KDB07_11170, partial [Planctomycetes bacterium]|nr:hypothetical protein [Planctomycetota bacterium]
MRKLFKISAVTLALAGLAASLVLTRTESHAANPQAPADWVNGWSGCLDYYNKSMKKNSLDRRTKGMVTLAATRDKRAITLLADRYAKAEEPYDYVRAIAINTLMSYRTQDDHKDSLNIFAASNKKSRDNWLHYRVWKNNNRNSADVGEALDIAKDSKADPWFRAAAIRMVAESSIESIEKLRLAMGLINSEAKLDEKGIYPDAIYRIGAAQLLEGAGADHDSDEFKITFEAVIAQLDLPKLPRAVKLAIARHLRKVFAIDTAYVNAGGWKQVMMEQAQGRRDADKGIGPVGGERDGWGKTGVKKKEPEPSFAGIPSNGDRFAYVIDISDSMLQPIKKPEVKPKDPPPKGPITGKAGKKKEEEDKKKKKKDASDLPSEEDIDWTKIKNRFELAREYLKISLLRTLAISELKENKDRDMYFTIIFYNENAEFLK